MRCSRFHHDHVTCYLALQHLLMALCALAVQQVCRTKVTTKQVYRVAAAAGLLSAQHCDPGCGDASKVTPRGARANTVVLAIQRVPGPQCMALIVANEGLI